MNKRETKTISEYCGYIKGKYYGILCDYEKGWDYQELLDSLLIELLGLFQEYDGPHLNSLYSKTCALKYLKYKYFRSTVMTCMKLVDKVFGG